MFLFQSLNPFPLQKKMFNSKEGSKVQDFCFIFMTKIIILSYTSIYEKIKIENSYPPSPSPIFAITQVSNLKFHLKHGTYWCSNIKSYLFYFYCYKSKTINIFWCRSFCHSFIIPPTTHKKNGSKNERK